MGSVRPIRSRTNQNRKIELSIEADERKEKYLGQKGQWVRREKTGGRERER